VKFSKLDSPVCEAFPTVLISLPGQQITDIRQQLKGLPADLIHLKVGQWVGHAQKTIIRHPPQPGDGTARGGKLVGDDGYRGNSPSLQQNSVEHTARAARPSIPYPADDHIASAHNLVKQLPAGGLCGRMLLPEPVALGPGSLDQGLGNFIQHRPGVMFCIIHQTDPQPFEALGTRGVG